uniref:RNase H type-1 domain-containing protein n=1 Tax=Nicotiana tabacum TaxID=4097 RepID=A0A1S4AXY0_TOBAC|nr:PREDICTED: uncharacterized protein LOC107802536 [Nicotiana tabacum]
MKLNPEKCAFCVASDFEAYLSKLPLLSKPRDDEITHLFCRIRSGSKRSIERLAKWAIELSEYDIIYQTRTAIKSYVLADFIAAFSSSLLLEAENEVQIITESNLGTWTLYTDGSSNVKKAALDNVLISPLGEIIRQAIKCYPITNKEAEYESVITCLESANEMGIDQVEIKRDSQLVVNQMQENYVSRETHMQQYLKKVRELLCQFQVWKAIKIPREENVEADALANMESVADVSNTKNVIVMHLFQSALDQSGMRFQQFNMGLEK